MKKPEDGGSIPSGPAVTVDIMPKILFVVNSDANEAFGTSTIDEVKPFLEAMGNEVVVRKIYTESTLLGKIIKVSKPSRYSVRDQRLIYTELMEIHRKLALEVKPDFIVGVHCTEKAGLLWKKPTPRDAAFTIRFVSIPGLTVPVAELEIKAIYRKLPERILAKIRQRTTRGLRSEKNSKDYLSQTTAQQLMREAGLPPEVFGLPIAKMVDKLARQGDARPVMHYGRVRKTPPVPGKSVRRKRAVKCTRRL
jgi:hypothetical protein